MGDYGTQIIKILNINIIAVTDMKWMYLLSMINLKWLKTKRKFLLFIITDLYSGIWMVVCMDVLWIIFVFCVFDVILYDVCFLINDVFSMNGKKNRRSFFPIGFHCVYIRITNILSMEQFGNLYSIICNDNYSAYKPLIFFCWKMMIKCFNF